MANSLTGIIKSMWDVMQMMVPKTVDPILFYMTFVMTAVVIYVILMQIKFFEKAPGVRLVICIVTSYFTASSAFVTILVSKLFPNIGLAIMAIMGIMLVAVFLAPDSLKKDGFPGTPIIVIVVFIITLWLTWSFAAPELEKTGVLSMIKGPTGSGISNEDAAVVGFFLFGAFVLYMVFKPSTSSGRGTEFIDWLAGRRF
jgi:hypothetical protein